MDIVQEFSGTWEEALAQEEVFAGRQVRIQLLENKVSDKRTPNTAWLKARREMQRLQADMKPSPAEDTVALIRQARSGEMFGGE